MPLKEWVSKRLDFSLGDWLFALWACSSPTVERATERVEGLWGQGMVGLSVRSLFDLYLKANRWAPGDRIVFTALTVGDMPRIAREHNLEVASVDLDPHSTEPDIDALAAVMTPRTRSLVFTHLYGARVDVSAAMAMARDRGVHFVEDCAEAYAGPGWRGHANSDLTLFSFGPIKTAPAFGGGLARVAPQAAARAMHSGRRLPRRGSGTMPCSTDGRVASRDRSCLPRSGGGPPTPYSGCSKDGCAREIRRRAAAWARRQNSSATWATCLFPRPPRARTNIG